MDSISGIIKRLSKMVSPTMFFIGIGLVIAIQAFIIYKLMPLASDIALIKTALGVITPQ